MHSSDRLHALDSVRAFALLSGIALHAAQPFIAGLPWVSPEPPNNGLASVWYTIHIFRMPLFFLIAGFFGRMLLERKGLGGFIRDRSRRILLPLVVGVPIIMLVTGLAFVLGALASGADPHTLKGLQPPPSSGPHNALASINLIHLWFLYYLVIFYAIALAVRCASRLAFAKSLRATSNAAVRFLMRGAWGPFILAAPVAIYYCQLKDWSPWGGLPAPMSLIPDTGALLAYGLFFAFGWLLQRQQDLLSSLAVRWPIFGVLAVTTWAICRAIAGSTPHWGPFLTAGELIVYTTSYIAAGWCWSFTLLGLALRYLAGYSPARRYIADSSYWLYLMHIPALIFFEQALQPLPWFSTAKYVLCISGALVVLLLSYRYMVRFTFIGATLNGRRHPRSNVGASPVAALT